MRNLAALCLCLGLAASATASAQQPVSPSQQPFRTSVEAVEIDVRVVDAAGRPVHGLTAADFEVYEDGVRQDIRVFTPVTIPFEPRPRAGRALESDVQTNRVPFNGRLYVFVLDDLHTHPLRTQRVRAAMREFLDRHFAANDRAAIVTTSGRVESVQDLTSSRASLLAALDGFTGQQIRSSALERIDEYFRLRNVGELRDEKGNTARIDDRLEPERAYHARRALTTLQNVGKWLETVPARRKALVFVSEGIDYDLQNLVENRFASGLLDDVRQVIAQAVRSNTNIYAIDPRGLGGLEQETIEVSSMPDDTTAISPGIFMDALRWTQDNLRVLAQESGGFALLNTNDLAGGFERLVRENSDYYVLGYQPTNTRADGRFRTLQVRATRPDLRVVARNGYFAPRGDRKPATANTPVMRALLDNPLPVTGLTIDSTAAIFRASRDKASALVTVEIGPEVGLTEQDGTHVGRVDVSVAAVNMDGRIAAAENPAVHLKLRPQTRELVTTYGLRTTTRLELKPGRYQLRIVARDATTGKAGSVMHDVRVPDFAAQPVALSDLVLASVGATRLATTTVDAMLKDVLTVPPTAIRQFEPRDTLTVLAELYDNRKRGTDPVRVTTSVADADGRVVWRLEESVEAFAFDPKTGAYRHHPAIALKDLAPGEYVVKVEVQPSSADRPQVREVPFSVRTSSPLVARG
jgi:VWFA-related protein